MDSPASENPVPAPQPPPSGMEKLETAIASWFVGPSGIRAAWRCLIFAAILIVCGVILLAGVTAVYSAFHHGARPKHFTFTVSNVFLQELLFVISMFVAAFVMSKIERRPMGQYGLPLRAAFRRRFWEGVVWGLAAISATMALIAALHGFTFGTLALSGSALVGYAVLWAIAFLLTGFFEEFTFRGYSQFTLTTGMGFWPAAILLSTLFGAGHLHNAGEAWPGALSAGLIGFFFCLTLRRTGNIWFAVGLHAAWDYGETFVYGVPDSGFVAPGHLLNSSFHGPRWLTGGSVGPEGSVACFVVIALLFLVFSFVYPPRAPNSAER